MRSSRLYSKLMTLAMVTAGICAFAIATEAATRLTIILKDSGVSAVPATRHRGGDYTIVVKNFSSTARGVQISGTDRGGSQYVRYSKIIPRGSVDKLDWFFPRSKSATFRDVLTCNRDARSCIRPTYAGHKLTIHFR